MTPKNQGKRGRRSSDRGSSLAGAVPGPAGEFVDLALRYAKQEILGPLRGLGRFVIFGVAGSVFLTFGLALLLLAALRALQTETGSSFSGNATWLPYLIVAAGALAIMAAAAWRIGRGVGHSRRAQESRAQKSRAQKSRAEKREST